MKIHFIIKNKDVSEDYFTEAKQINNTIIFKKDDVTTKFEFGDDIIIERVGQMHYIQRYALNELVRGKYEILGLTMNISVYTKKMNINESGVFIEYDQYIDDKFESTIKIYLKF